MWPPGIVSVQQTLLPCVLHPHPSVLELLTHCTGDKGLAQSVALQAACMTQRHMTPEQAQVCADPCSLRDMLYRRRMERQLAQARGLMSGEGKMPPPEDGEVGHSGAGLGAIK